MSESLIAEVNLLMHKILLRYGKIPRDLVQTFDDIKQWLEEKEERKTV